MLCSITFFLNRVFYKILLRNIVDPDKLQMTIWRMRTARWIPTSTHTRNI